MRFSRTVKSGRMPLPSGTWAMPRRTISSGRRPVIAVPPSAILPDAALAMPLMALSRVDLPDPLAPRMATSWPVSTFMETSCNASTEPYRTLRSVTSSIGGLAEIGGDDAGVAQHLGGQTVGDELPEIEHDQPLAQPRHERHVVLDDQDAEAEFLPQLEQQRRQVVDLGIVQP